MIGGLAPAMSGSAPAAPAPEAAFKGTMIGGVAFNAVASPAGPSMPAPDAAAPGTGFKGTMLGMAPAGANAGAMPASPNATLPTAGPTPPMAPQALASQQHAQQAYAPQALAEPAPAPGLLGEKRTMLGVAIPGIAPLHPGMAKPAQPMPAYTPPPAYAPAPAYLAPNAPFTQEELAAVSKRGGDRHVSPLMLVLILVISGLLAFGGIAVYLALKGPALHAEPTVDASGNLQLELTCDGCPDATSVQLDGKTARFRARRATLPLAHPLKIGDNALTVAMTAPGSSHADLITLKVPVQFRVHGDLTALAETPPKLRVRVEAVTGTQVVVDGKPLALDARGTGTYDADVSSRLVGSSPNSEQLEQKIAYTLTPPGGAPRNDSVTFQTAIVPLMVETPGDSIVIENANFMLTGWTQKGAAVTVAGRAIPLDDQGRFEQLMSVSAVGETTIDVRAIAPERAPRLAPIHVKRVAHLADEAAKYRAQAESNYATIAEDPVAKKGARVALDGTATDVRIDNHVTVLLLDVHEGCAAAPCLARVLYSTKIDVTNGDTVSAFGKLVGAVDGPRTGSRIPNVMAEFVLRGQK